MARVEILVEIMVLASACIWDGWGVALVIMSQGKQGQFPTKADLAQAIEEAEERGWKASKLARRVPSRKTRTQVNDLLRKVYIVCEGLQGCEEGSVSARKMLWSIKELNKEIDSLLGIPIMLPSENCLNVPYGEEALPIEKRYQKDTPVRIREPVRINTGRFEKLADSLFQTLDLFAEKDRRSEAILEHMREGATEPGKVQELRNIPDDDLSLAVGPPKPSSSTSSSESASKKPETVVKRRGKGKSIEM